MPDSGPNSGPLLLIGCGKMGGALLDGWIESGAAAGGVHVIEPMGDAVRRFQAQPDIHVHASLKDAPPDLSPSVIILAVKPQAMDEAVVPLASQAPLASRDWPKAVFLSIAAGKTLGYFEARLGADAAIVRAMPNTPAAVGRGITVYVPNANVSAAQATACGSLLEAVGEAVAVDDEGLLDPVTAVSGSGPAYVFLLIEAMAAAGAKAGLPAALAMQLARATVAGSGELARLSPDAAATLRQNVTSPGGTTAAALDVLMAEDGIQPVFDRAIDAATRRSRELAG